MDENEMLKRIYDVIAKEDQEPSVLNPQRCREFVDTWNIVKYLFANDEAIKISYKMNEPFNSVSYITVVGKSINILNPHAFCHAAKFASNFTITPMRNGKIEIAFTFHDMTMS